MNLIRKYAENTYKHCKAHIVGAAAQIVILPPIVNSRTAEFNCIAAQRVQ